MFGNTDAICTGVFLIPGTELLPLGVLAVAYFITLSWLFLGISIIAEMFMAGIEKITSVTRKVKTGDGPEDYKMVLVWNPTVANLSLMALGSSAPEILLSVIEAVSTLGECPGELGPSTIVGSAAFNLLVISGLSILAVTEENDTDPRRDQSLLLDLRKSMIWACSQLHLPPQLLSISGFGTSSWTKTLSSGKLGSLSVPSSCC